MKIELNLEGKNGVFILLDENNKEVGELTFMLKEEQMLINHTGVNPELRGQGLAEKLAEGMQQGDDIALVIGGADGVSPEVLAKADVKWSLSALTLPHPLVRVVLMEQLYRAMSINHNHPYHRGN